MGYAHLLPPDHKPLQLTVGAGAAGRKTNALRADYPHIVRAGLGFPDHISFTPAFFRDVLVESGAHKASSGEEVARMLENYAFPPHIKGMISDSLEAMMDSLPREAREALFRMMVRSDDYAIGVGLWYSGPACVPAGFGGEKRRMEELLRRIESEMKKVLASDWSENVRHFKERKGIRGTPGVMLMPLLGERLTAERNNTFENVFGPLLAINFLGDVKGRAIVSVGAGLGGANSSHAGHTVGMTFPITRFASHPYSKLGKWQTISLETGAIEEVRLGGVLSALSAMLASDESFRLALHAVEGMVQSAVRLAGGKRYFELVLDDSQTGHWTAVQSAPFDVPDIERPHAKGRSTALSTPYVVGTALLHSERIRYASAMPGPKDLEYNKANRGYVLVIEAFANETFRELWSYPYFSNAAAIILNVANDAEHQFHTHLNGAAREYGIPVMSGRVAKTLLGRMKRGEELQAACTIYVNEFEGGACCL